MPDNSTPYLEDLPGVKDVRIRNGSLLPRRSVLEIDGARVYDDAVNAQTVIEVRPPFVVQPIAIAAFPTQTASTFQCPNTNADLYRFADITEMRGLGAPGAGDRRKVWLLNAHASSLSLIHNSGSAPAANRFNTPDGDPFVLAANGGMVQVAHVGSRWLILG